jgi:hypothetical protein
MAIGTFGNIRPADINPADLDMYYTYTPNRETLPNGFTALTATDILSEYKLPSSDPNFVAGQENLMGGVYNMTLPATIFNQLGIYTIFIRPKVVRIKITDCGVLSSLPSIKGIVINANDLDANLRSNNALQGYRIEYIESDGTKLRNVVRYVTTSNRVVPVTDNIANTSQTAVRYRFDDSGNLLFLQVTPSSASAVKPNVNPFIGSPGQDILIANTNVNPETIEIEMVENTIDTLVDYVAGEQIRDVKKGILTYYDKNREITKQFDVYNIEDNINNEELFEVKEKRTTIDTSQDFDTITNDVNGA